MKTMQIILLLLMPVFAFAVDESEISNAVNARIALLQTESAQLESAINTLSTMQLTDTEKFELIAVASFNASDEVVASYGFTLKQLYAFEARNEAEIATWLDAHPDQGVQINTLEANIESLQGQFDQVINTEAVQ